MARIPKPVRTPGQKAGLAVRRVVTAKNPVVGRIAGKAIEKGVDKLVTKGLTKVQDPAFQKKVGQTVKRVAKAGVNKLSQTPRGAAVVNKVAQFSQTPAGQTAVRGARRLGTNALAKLNEFGQGHGQPPRV
jgi:hypothetical protein